MKLFLSILAVVVLVGAGYFLFHQYVLAPGAHTGPRYENETYGFSFIKPEGYVLAEQTVTDTQYAVSLIAETDTALPEAGEGPTAITVNVYDTNAVDVLAWMRTDMLSNYNLGTGAYTQTTIAGAPAVAYQWSGLYEGETVAFMHEGRVIAVSVTTITPTDPIRDAYASVLGSFTLR